MKRKPILVILVLVIIAAIAGVAYLRLRPATTAATTTGAQTAAVMRGSLSATVNAAGNIASQQTAALTFGQSGTVKKIDAKVGSRVKAGDVLAELETADLELQLRSSQVSLKNAENNLGQVKSPATEREIANARAALASAQAAYDEKTSGADAGEVAAAQASLASAQASYDSAVKSAAAGSSSLVSATTALEKARITLQSAQGEYDKVSWRGDVGASSQAATLQTATLDYNSAKAAYESVAATAKSDADSKVASALSSLQSARVNYTKVKASVTQAELAAAQSSLTQAKNNLDELLAGPTAAELASAQNSVESAQIALSQVKLKLQQAQVIAPFDGVITTISAKIGQTASGTAMEIADLDRLIISVNMSEVDINKVKVGQPAQVTLDAVTDASFSGLVSLIAPAGVQSSGVVNYPVTVVVDKPTEAVKTGMTANVNITVQKSENVLLVPNRAVKTVNRQKVVTVLLEGRQVVVPVQTGLSGDSMTEISSGLKEGDLVVVNATTTSTSTRGMGIGVPGIGGGGPPPGM